MIDANKLIPFKTKEIYRFQKLLPNIFSITAEKKIGRNNPLSPIIIFSTMLMFAILQRIFGRGNRLNSSTSAPNKTAAIE